MSDETTETESTAIWAVVDTDLWTDWQIATMIRYDMYKQGSACAYNNTFGRNSILVRKQIRIRLHYIKFLPECSTASWILFSRVNKEKTHLMIWWPQNIRMPFFDSILQINPFLTLSLTLRTIRNLQLTERLESNIFIFHTWHFCKSRRLHLYNSVINQRLPHQNAYRVIIVINPTSLRSVLQRYDAGKIVSEWIELKKRNEIPTWIIPMITRSCIILCMEVKMRTSMIYQLQTLVGPLFMNKNNRRFYYHRHTNQ